METCSVVHHRIVFRVAIVLVVVIGSALRLWAQEPVPLDHYDPDDIKTFADVSTEDRTIEIRGRQFVVHFYRRNDDASATPAIYACGDGGWRGLAPRTAQQLAHVGFAVAGIDSKIYLKQFSSTATPLTTRQLASDYVDVAKALRQYARVGPATPVFVYGWSLGAGFAIAVGADQATRSNWAGIISIGLPKQNQLVSGVGGNHVDLKSEAFAGFRTQDLMAAIAPVPLVMIQSTTDTASPIKVGRALFDAAAQPKQFVLIKANNHRFTGAREEFYAALSNAAQWMKDTFASSSQTETGKHGLEFQPQ
jgi:dienelactone hydrolase